jgi:hypothetical protein
VKAKKYIMGSVLFLVILACSMPGLSQPAAIPTFDQNAIPTMVALTANAGMAKTAVSTSPTPEPPPTATIIATPKVSLSGSSLILRDDKTTVFTDYRTGIELIIPAGWLALRINEQEYYDAWTLPELSDPAFQGALTGINNLNPNESRLFAFDVQDGHLQRGFVTNINLLWSESEDISLDNDADLQDIADSTSKATPGLKILSTDISANSSGIPIGVITSKVSRATLDGTKLVVFNKMLFVKARTGVLIITLTTTQELKDAVLPAFDVIFETITLVKE